MVRRILVVSLVLSWLCAAAHAEEKADDARSGIYLGLGGSFGIDMAFEDVASERVREALEAIGYASLGAGVSASPGANLRVGYRFHPHLAAELELDYLPMFVTDVESVEVTRHQILVMTANAKLPVLTGRIEPFLLVGAGLVWAKVENEQNLVNVLGIDDERKEELEDELGLELEDALDLGLAESRAGFGIRAGAGMDIHVSENISFTLDASYVLPFGDVKDLDFISLGLGVQYRF